MNDPHLQRDMAVLVTLVNGPLAKIALAIDPKIAIAADAGLMTLTVKTLSGKLVAVGVPRNATTLGVKLAVQDKEGFAPEQQRLVYQGVQLEGPSRVVSVLCVSLVLVWCAVRVCVGCLWVSVRVCGTRGLIKIGSLSLQTAGRCKSTVCIAARCFT